MNINIEIQGAELNRVITAIESIAASLARLGGDALVQNVGELPPASAKASKTKEAKTATKAKAAEEPQPEAKQEPVQPISLEDFRTQIIDEVRNGIGKDAMKELLAKYKATSVTEVKEADRRKILAELNRG